MRKIRFAPQALADLEEAKRYISEDLFNPQAAADLVALVFAKIRPLAALPQSGALLKTKLSVLNNYRFIPCKNYLVFYRVEQKYVSIIRILYAKRDFAGLLELEADSGEP